MFMPDETQIQLANYKVEGNEIPKFQSIVSNLLAVKIECIPQKYEIDCKHADFLFPDDVF